jgi:hypothetical protein
MVAIVLLRGVFQRGGYAVALGRVVIDQIGDLEHAARSGLDQLEAGHGIGALPLAKFFNDVLDLFYLVLGALARVDARDMDDRFFRQVENFQDVVGIGTGSRCRAA